MDLEILYVSVFQFKLGCDIAWAVYLSCEKVCTCAVRHVIAYFFPRNKMASGFGGYEEFVNIMRTDTTEEVTPDNQITWFAVDNTTVDVERTLLDFGDLRNGDIKHLASLGEGWGSATESPVVDREATTATTLTINEAFTWMATYPGVVLIGTFTLGGKCYYYTEFKIS